MSGGATLTRRGLLQAGMATAGATLAMGACTDDEPAVSTASPRRRIDHIGSRQPGITTPQPAHGAVAAFDTTAADRTELLELFRALAAATDRLATGTADEVGNPLLPPADNLILGTAPAPDDLTVTVSLGASLFDDRFGLADRRPRHLERMPNFPNDEPHPERSHGDIAIQICAGSETTVTHALRRLMRASRRSLALRWMQSGFVEPSTLPAGRTSTRNLLGFKDGTANLDPGDGPLMDELVWVGDGDDEPAWARGGSYQVVRIIRTRVEFWDRTALATQELIIGRAKATGAPLDGELETDAPRFADVGGAITPLGAHIRLANPRTDATQRNRILRRGFNFSSGFTKDGQLDQGLLFVCYQRDLANGFVAVQRRLDGEALEEYIRPVGGGFFFVPPGRTQIGEPFAAALLA